MLSRMYIVSFLCIMLSGGCLMQGCGKSDGSPEYDDVLLSMGDSVLTLNDVVSRIPVGISSTDSAAIFERIVDNWIEGMVLTDMAKEKLPDLPEIEQRVNDYRNRLIVMSYLEKMRNNAGQKVHDDSIRNFYEKYHKEMLSEQPLVKGILLKFPESVNELGEIRRCVFTADSKSLDELERRWATDALQYEYFENTWVDWQKIAEQIPYRFFDPDAFVTSTRNFETSSGGSVYLLHISDYLPSGSELPFEFAAPRIRALLEQAKLAKYERALVESLVKRSIADEKLVVRGYDPVKRQLIKGGELRENKGKKDEK